MRGLIKPIFLLTFPGLVAAAAMIEWSIPSGMEQAISSTLESRLGARMHYERGRFSLRDGVKFERLVFTGPEGDTVVADSASAFIPWNRLGEFLTGRGTIASVTISGLDITIARNREGRFLIPIEPPRLSELFEVRFDSGRLRYRDIPLGIDRTATGLSGTVRLSDSIEGVIQGAGSVADAPGADKPGAGWSLALRPHDANSVDFDLFVHHANALETGHARGVITREEAGALSAMLAIEASAPFVVRLLERRIPASGLLSFTGRATGGDRTFRIDGTLSADVLSAGSIALTDLRAHATSDEKGFTLSKATARLFGGTATISSGGIPFADPEQWRTAGRIERASAASAMRGRLGAASVAGTLSCDFDLRGDPSAFEKLTGRARFTVADGSLSAPALDRLALRAGDPSLKPLPFRRLSAQLVFRRDGVAAERIAFAGPRIDAHGAARVNAAKRIDGEMTFLVAKDLGAKVVGPVASVLPTESGRAVVPTQLAGTLDDPEVHPMVGRLAAGAALGMARNATKPVFLLVGGLQRSLNDIFGGKKESTKEK